MSLIFEGIYVLSMMRWVNNSVTLFVSYYPLFAMIALTSSMTCDMYFPFIRNPTMISGKKRGIS